jgi:hypothetical protein
MCSINDTAIEELEELEAIRAYDAAKASGDQAIPFEQAIAEVESDRERTAPLRTDHGQLTTDY